MVRKNVVIFLVVAALLLTMANATVHIVGDGSGWHTGVNYAAWTSGKTFRVGDHIDFYYDASQHDVLQVSKEDFDACSPSSPLTSDNSGYSTLSLTGLGTVYIICGTEGHCKQGMKMQVNVVGYSSSPYEFKSAVYIALAFSLMMIAAI